MEEKVINQGGLQSVQTIAPQYIYLDFDGETTSYWNRDLDISIDVEVEDSKMSEEQKLYILSELSEKYDSEEIVFTIERPDDDIDYSTIFIGKTDDFDGYGSFAGLAETIDKGNQIKDDNAFVSADYTSNPDKVVSVIEHEVGHIYQGMEHEITFGTLEDYAAQEEYEVTGNCSWSNLFAENSYTKHLGYKNDGYLFIVHGSAYTEVTITITCTSFNASPDTRGSLLISLGVGEEYDCSFVGKTWQITLYNSSLAFSVACYVNSWNEIAYAVNARFSCDITYTVIYDVWISAASLSNVSGSGNNVTKYTTEDNVYFSFMARDSHYLSVGQLNAKIYVDNILVFDSRLTGSGGDGNCVYRVNDLLLGKFDAGVHTLDIYISVDGTFTERNFNNNYDRLTFVVNSIQNVGANEVISGASVGKYGYLHIKSGGIVSNAVIESGGSAVVFEGGSLVSATVESGGNLYVSQGGSASINFNPWGGNITSDPEANVTYLDRDAAVYIGNQRDGIIFKQNTADSLVIGNGSSAIVYSGGSVANTTLGGQMFVHSGASITDTLIQNGGSAVVFEGGSLVSATVEYGGNLYVSQGGSASINFNPWGGNITSDPEANVTYLDRDAAVYIGNQRDGIIFKQNTADSLVIGNGSSAIVYSGGSVANTTLGGQMFVHSGSSITDTLIQNGGYISASGGAVFRQITLESNGELYVGESCQISGIQIASGARFNNFTLQSVSSISSEVNISNAAVESQREAILYSGQTACNTSVNYGGKMIISSGAIHSGTLNIAQGGSVSACQGAEIRLALGGRRPDSDFLIYNISQLTGAPAYTISVSSNLKPGEYRIASGAENFNGSFSVTLDEQYLGTLTVNGDALNENAASYLLYKENGNLYLSVKCDLVIFSGEKESGCIISAPYSGTVMSGGELSGATVTGNGQLYVSGIADGITISSGTLHVCRGGVVSNTTLHTSDSIYVSLAGYMVNTDISGGGTLYTEGIVDNTTLENEGSLQIMEKSIALSTTINANGKATVQSGGIAYWTTVNSDGSLYVSNGGCATGTILNSSGYVSVAKSAIMFNTVINDNYMYIRGYASKTVLNNGRLYAYSSGVIDNTSVNSRSVVSVYWGAVANNTSVNSGGYMYVVSKGIASNTTVNVGGVLVVSEGGTATKIIENGGYVSGYFSKQAAFASNTFGGIALSSGSMTVHSNTVASDITINGGGYLYVFSGGIATEIVENGGYVSVESGAQVTFASNTLSGIEVQNTSLSVHSNTVANNISLLDVGRMKLCGGIANSTHIYSGGSLDISSGVANSTVMNSGCYMYVRGGIASNTIVKYGVVIMSVGSGGIADNTRISGGYMFTLGTANNTTVEYGSIRVFGGTAENTSVTDGMIEIGSTGKAICTTVASGRMYIYSGGIASNTTVARGSMYICGSGIASSTTVMSGGKMTVSSGGIAENTTIYSGASVFISSGGRIREAQISNGAAVSAYSGGIIDFSIEKRTDSDTYLINNLSLISGAPEYTITVSALQANGTYKLAQNAALSGSFVIGDKKGAYGSITVNGSDFVYGGVTYSLDQISGNLTLTVSGAQEAVLSGNADSVSWSNIPGTNCTVQYSQDNFENILQIQTATDAVDTYQMPGGSYQWQVVNERGYSVQGNNISADTPSNPVEVISDADGNTDVFFANASGIWEKEYFAQHSGILNSWEGTGEEIHLAGKNKITDIFSGSTDAGILVMTDDANGDALFLDDIYTALGNQARLAQIDEIRAGAGNDIVDMTSQQFSYAGNGIKIYGGLGDDTIWANNGNNILFGDAGNDRLVGGTGNDIIIGGVGNDSMHGGGGDDIFFFAGSWGSDTIEQLDGGKVTLWFKSGYESSWNASTCTYTAGYQSVRVTGTSDITLKFGDSPELPAGVFLDAASEKIFEDKNKGFIV